MKCEQSRELFSPLIEGDLPEDEQARVREHVVVCGECRERFRRFEQGIQVLRDLPRHPVPRSFAGDVLARLAEGDGQASSGAQVAAAKPRSKFASGAPWRIAAAFLLGAVCAMGYVELRVLGIGNGRETLVRLDAAQAAHSETMAALYDRFDAAHRDLSSLQERTRSELAERGEMLVRDVRSQAESLRGLDAAVRELEQRDHTRESDDGGVRRELTALRAQLGTLSDELERRVADESASRREVIDRLTERIDGLAESAGGIGDQDPNAIVRRTPESPVIAARVEADEEAPVVLIREGNRRILRPDWNNPGTAAFLFGMYESRDPDLAPLAFNALDQHFRDRAKNLVAEREARDRKANQQGPIAGILGNRAEAAPEREDLERRLVQIYKEYWEQEQRRAKSPGAAGKQSQ